MRRIIDRYPGSKAGYGFHDNQHYDAIIEPFAGAASTTFENFCRVNAAFWGEADVSVRAIYSAWLCCQHEDVENIINHGYISDPEYAFLEAKAILDSNHHSRVEKAAASLFIRKLTFSGIIRTSKKGKLNIKPCVDQYDVIKSWRFEYPPIPNAEVRLYPNWQKCLFEYSRSQYKQALCIIDPPYYADKITGCTTMTAAYPGHEPHTQDTLEMCINAASIALSMANIKRVVVCNYYSDALDKSLGQMTLGGQPPRRFDLGVLDTCQNHGEKKSNYSESIWDWGGLPQWFPKKAAKQLTFV